MNKDLDKIIKFSQTSLYKYYEMGDKGTENTENIRSYIKKMMNKDKIEKLLILSYLCCYDVAYRILKYYVAEDFNEEFIINTYIFNIKIDSFKTFIDVDIYRIFEHDLIEYYYYNILHDYKRYYDYDSYKKISRLIIKCIKSKEYCEKKPLIAFFEPSPSSVIIYKNFDINLIIKFISYDIDDRILFFFKFDFYENYNLCEMNKNDCFSLLRNDYIIIVFKNRRFERLYREYLEVYKNQMKIQESTIAKMFVIKPQENN